LVATITSLKDRKKLLPYVAAMATNFGAKSPTGPSFVALAFQKDRNIKMLMADMTALHRANIW